MSFKLSLVASAILIFSLNASETSVVLEQEQNTTKVTKKDPKKFVYKKDINASEFPYILPIAVEEAPIEEMIEAPLKAEAVVVEAPALQEPDSDADGVLDINDKCPDTPKEFKVDSVGCPQTAILKVNFETDKYDIKQDKSEEIKNFAAFLKNNIGYNAIISGHTDSSGSTESNQVLSENRANAVKQALIVEGIDAGRLTAIGEGESRPIADNLQKAGRAENRRIEVELKSTIPNQL